MISVLTFLIVKSIGIFSNIVQTTRQEADREQDEAAKAV